MTFRNILIVCIGNICRSPIAEGLLRHALSEKNESCHVSSAGLGALVGHQPDRSSCALMLRKNIDISGYKARQIDNMMIRKADLILVMETSHKSAIEEMEPSAKGKVFRLGHWGNYEIPDPYQKDFSAFEMAFSLIDQGVSEWLKKL